MTTRRSRHHETEYINIETRLCIACGECSAVCKPGVIRQVKIPLHKHAAIRGGEKCVGCMRCVQVCPEHAITSRQIRLPGGSS